MVPAGSAAPSAVTAAEALQALTAAITGLQLQMMAINHQLADQGARLSALDGRPALPQFGLPGFGSLPALPASSAPAISEIPAAVDSAGLALSTAPLSSPAAQGARLPPPPHPRGVPIHQISFPHSPSPVPSLSSVMQPLPQAPTAHMSAAAPYHTSTSPEWEGNAVRRYHKLMFPVYEGAEDLLGWLNTCEQFFRGQQTREADKVWLASYHLKGVA